MRSCLGSLVVLGGISLGVAACNAQVAPEPGSPSEQTSGAVGGSPESGSGATGGSSYVAAPPGEGMAPSPLGPPMPTPTFVAPTPFPWVAGCPAPPVDAWTPAAAPTGTIEDLNAYADAVRASFAGHWVGEQSIFGTHPPVAFSFEASGHYSGICLAAGCWATIYNGSDNESPYKKYKLDAMSLDGISSGLIDLAFPPQASMGEDPSSPPSVPPSGTTLLQKIVLDASGNRLRFDLVDHMHAPPYVAHYDLHRCP
jgi:hypothetical protein